MVVVARYVPRCRKKLLFPKLKTVQTKEEKKLGATQYQKSRDKLNRISPSTHICIIHLA